MPDDEGEEPKTITAMLWRAAERYGPLTVVLAVFAFLFWQEREKDIQVLREQVVSDREYIRGEFSELIERNTEAFRDLKEELAKRHE